VDTFFLDVATSALQVMDGSNMFVSGSTGTLASKTAASTSSGAPTPLDVIEPGETDSGFYDIIIVLNGPDGANFSDDADLGVTFEFICT